ncbi:hypothetical protein [Cryobacterium sp. Y11]|uniref:hypothetical protein n=1 Tax=Cryobacterium sp. Y11 TaxID=2045016 RepID=UPI000CE3707F|nr:hypothetical protein [Cryobacterium sp. Y11]
MTNIELTEVEATTVATTLASQTAPSPSAPETRSEGESETPEVATPAATAKSGAAKPRRRWYDSLGHVHGPWALLIIVLSAVIAGFADPSYGVNWMSLRLLTTFVTVFAVFNYGGAMVKRIVGFRVRQGYRPRITARPMYLAIILVTVMFGRGTGVSPALIFGSVLALDYGLQTVGTARTALVTIGGAVWAALLGLAAYAGYTFLVVRPIPSFIEWQRIDPNIAFVAHQATEFGNVALGEFFSTLCIAALSSLPIALLPFAFLEGANLWRYNRVLWVIVYAFGATIYSYVLVPLPASWDEITVTVGAWAGVYLAYAAIAVAVWAYFRYAKPRSPAIAP